MRTLPFFFALSLLFLLPACSSWGEPQSDDDDDSGGDDDDDSGDRLVLAPGVFSIALASAENAEVSLDLAAPAPGLRVRLKECEVEDGWRDLPLPAEVTPSLSMSIELPSMERGTRFCGVELSFGDEVQIEGSYELASGETQPFLLVIELDDLVFELNPVEIDEDGAFGLLVQLAQNDWVSPQQIGYPPEPERGDVYVVGRAHSAYNSFVQQLENFSGVFFDLDGDGALGGAEADSDRPGDGLRGPEGERFGAFGGSICLDQDEFEDEGCENPEFHVPLAYLSLDTGVSWQLAESPKMAVPTAIRAADYGDGLYLAVGGADTNSDGQVDQGVVLSSVDAESWGAWLVEEPLTGIAFADPAVGWVAVSEAGTTYRSHNGVAWKANDSAPVNFEIRDVDWSSAGFFIAVADQGKWAWSVDGDQWTEEVLNLSDTLPSLRKVTVTSEGNAVVVGDSGVWLELNNPDDFSGGLAPAIWIEQFVVGAPNLTGVAVYSDEVSGEIAVAVGPDMSVPVLVTQTVGGLDVSVPPLLTELEPGIQAQAITIMADRCFTIAGEAGLSSWLDDLLSDSAAVPHSDVTHPISVVMTGGE